MPFDFSLAIEGGETRTREWTHREGKRLHITVETKLKHLILLIAWGVFFGGGGRGLDCL